MQGNPCKQDRESRQIVQAGTFKYYRENPVGNTMNPCKSAEILATIFKTKIQGFPCWFVLICFHLLQGLQDTGKPCYDYMQVTGQNWNTGIPCTHYREKINSVLLRPNKNSFNLDNVDQLLDISAYLFLRLRLAQRSLLGIYVDSAVAKSFISSKVVKSS